MSKYIIDNESQAFHWKGRRKLQVGERCYKQGKGEGSNEPRGVELHWGYQYDIAGQIQKSDM